MKGRRLEELIELQRGISLERNLEMIGKEVVILMEGRSKRSEKEWMGRTDCNRTVIVAKGDFMAGDYIHVVIESATSATLFGEVLQVETIPEAA